MVAEFLAQRPRAQSAQCAETKASLFQLLPQALYRAFALRIEDDGHLPDVQIAFDRVQ
jgi:hypothetical protein